MNALRESTQVEIEVVMEKTVVIDYDQSVHLIALPKIVREVSDHVDQVKLLRRGKKEITIVLLKLKPGLMHREVKRIMLKNDIEQAGLHEIFHFSGHFLTELLDEGVCITSLQEEMRDRGVEFVPTVFCYNQRKLVKIMMCGIDDLPFRNTYILGIKKIVPIIEI